MCRMRKGGVDVEYVIDGTLIAVMALSLSVSMYAMIRAGRRVRRREASLGPPHGREVSIVCVDGQRVTGIMLVSTASALYIQPLGEPVVKIRTSDVVSVEAV